MKLNIKKFGKQKESKEKIKKEGEKHEVGEEKEIKHEKERRKQSEETEKMDTNSGMAALWANKRVIERVDG